MGHNTLADKLDQITESDLGIQYNPDLMWDQISLQLPTKNRPAYGRLLLAACFTLLVLLIPISFLKQTRSVESLAISKTTPIEKSTPVVAEVEPAATITPARERMNVLNIERKTADLNLVISSDSEFAIDLAPIEVSKQTLAAKDFFNTKDISIIQAGLEEPEIGYRRKVQVRAHLHNLSTNSIDHSQKLKIKRYAKDK